MSSPSISRRTFLGSLGLASAGLALSPKASALEPFWTQPRSLDLIRSATGERFRGVYWANGQLDPAGYIAACRLLRDTRADAAVAMSPRLLDLLCAIQAWVRPYGFTDPIRITSGYRTPQTNASLEGAARQSMHLKGCAVDMRMPGLPVSYLGRLAQHYAAGGVGFYVSSNFVHVDTGRVRTWGRSG